MRTKSLQHGLVILRRRQVESRTGLARSSIYALIAAGHFPEPIRLTPNTVGWLEHEVEQWIAQRIQASRESE